MFSYIEGPPNGPALDTLVALTEHLDTPYQAWAAVALLESKEPQHQAYGRESIQNLLRLIPTEFEHGDLACYGLLNSYLPSALRERIVASLPTPSTRSAECSPLFRSPIYTYLIVRGVGHFTWVETLADLVLAEAISEAEDPRSDLVSLILRLATLVDLKIEVNSALINSLHARLITAPGVANEVIAVRWFVQCYGTRSKFLKDGAGLMSVAKQFSASWPPLREPDTMARPEATLMLLETIARGDRFVLLSRLELDRLVGSKLGRQRFLLFLACSFCLAIIISLPQIWAVVHWGIQPWMAGIAAACVLIPLTTWVFLAVFSRPKRNEPLWLGIVLGIGFYCLILYASATQNADVLKRMQGDDALFTMVPLIVQVVVALFLVRK